MKQSFITKFFSSGLESQLSNSNQPKYNSPFTQIFSTKNQILDTETIANSIAEFDFDINECNIKNSKLLSAFIITEVKIEVKKQFSK